MRINYWAGSLVHRTLGDVVVTVCACLSCFCIVMTIAGATTSGTWCAARAFEVAAM